jgi:hypothetical protein
MCDLPSYFEMIISAIYDFNLNVSKAELSPVWTIISNFSW